MKNKIQYTHCLCGNLIDQRYTICSVCGEDLNRTVVDSSIPNDESDYDNYEYDSMDIPGDY